MIREEADAFTLEEPAQDRRRREQMEESYNRGEGYTQSGGYDPGEGYEKEYGRDFAPDSVGMVIGGLNKITNKKY